MCSYFILDPVFHIGSQNNALLLTNISSIVGGKYLRHYVTPKQDVGLELEKPPSVLSRIRIS
jgi:hypothetical protein